MTALLLASVALAGAVNVALVAFVADRLTPNSATPVATGRSVVVNDTLMGTASLKHAA